MYLQALILVLSDGSNQIMWQHIAWEGWHYGNALWVRLMWPQFEEECMQYSSALPIQAWNSTKQNVCWSIFMSTEKWAQIKLSIIYPISKIASVNNNLPTLKARIRPPKDCWAFSSATWKHVISIPWKQCTSFFCLCWSRRITTLAYQQKPVLCTVYKTACGLAFFCSHLYPENIQDWRFLSFFSAICKTQVRTSVAAVKFILLSSLLTLNFEPWQHSSGTLKYSDLCFCSNVHYNIICI